MENHFGPRFSPLDIFLSICFILAICAMAIDYAYDDSNTQTENNIDQPEKTCVTEYELKQYDLNGSLVKTIVSEKCTWVGYYG
jgi:hypothetical protein